MRQEVKIMNKTVKRLIIAGAAVIAAAGAAFAAVKIIRNANTKPVNVYNQGGGGWEVIYKGQIDRSQFSFQILP